MQCLDDARAVEGQLRDAVDVHRGARAGEVEQRWRKVADMDQLVTDGAGVGDGGGVADDQGGSGAAEPREALPELERRVPCPGPCPGVVVVGRRSAPIVECRKVVGAALGDPGGEAMLVDAALCAALCAGTVVGEQDHHGVIEQAVSL